MLQPFREQSIVDEPRHPGSGRVFDVEVRLTWPHDVDGGARLGGAAADPSDPEGAANLLALNAAIEAAHAGPSGRYDTWRDEARVLSFLVRTV